MSEFPAVIVLGSLHYDIIVHGPDRPRKGETGGAGWSDGAHVGSVGDDDLGRALLANLRAHGVDASGVAELPGEKSGMSVAIFDAEGDYGAVIVSGANLDIATDALADIAAGWHDGSWLVLQNEIPEEANLLGARSMAAAGGKVILNAAPARHVSQELLDLVDILVVNAIEAEMLAGTPVVDSLAGAMRAAEILLKRSRAVIVTAGGEGCAYADNQNRRLSLPARKVTVASTHGAGDEFIGALVAELCRNSGIDAALNAANTAAAVLVSTPEVDR
jgi:ribokinase